MGYEPLRAAIADYAHRIRGVECGPEQVFIVGGSQQGLYLCGQVLLTRGDTAWVEDPGYPGARAAFAAADAAVVPVSVDDEGLVVATRNKSRQMPRLIYVTPSHQCPLGVTMSLARRLELLDLAARARAWIVEDDYDSEYRYFTRPLASLQSLDANGRVVYVGTFSKTLLPALSDVSFEMFQSASETGGPCARLRRVRRGSDPGGRQKTCRSAARGPFTAQRWLASNV
jgi:GntR family transcriptional regulator / MocR family aminotransferase